MITAVDLAQVTYEVPDLGRMEQFLRDFGLQTIERTADALYMRGTGVQHHLHVTRVGPMPRFIGASIEILERADLDLLALLPGSSKVEQSYEPGGGVQVKMMTPDGYEIRAIWGREHAKPVRQHSANAVNTGQTKLRANASVRVQDVSCEVIRLGHFVLHVSDHDASTRWFQERFDMLPSDHLLPPGSKGPEVGTFLRFNRKEQLVDHHSLLLLQSDKPGVHHCSFEVEDLDAVMRGHDHLKKQGYKLDCGVGRHLLGSQIYDYWRDPFGFRIEHYTDGDVVDASHRATRFNGTAPETTQWGIEPPLEFFQ
jgi:catechol 2,3-dioxygenase-like lactoylglutathione lyase family enzyme